MRQRAEEMESYSGGSGHYGKEDIMEAAKDVKSWVHGVIQIAVVTILYGESYDQVPNYSSPEVQSIRPGLTPLIRLWHFPPHYH